MTTQIHDAFELEPGEPFSVSGVIGTGLFDPRAHGLKPLAIHTGCYRGWYATYGLRGTEMVLAQLAIGVDLPDGQAPDVQLGGVSARKHRYWYETLDGSRHEEDTPEWFYDDLALPVGFSGGLLVGRGFIRELYVHMGFHPPWKFREVVELLFDGGRLVGRHDRSAQMAEVRARSQDNGPRSRSQEDVARWIEASFSLKYE